ncbi:MAG: OsmC family peroxiredoxin [Caldilineaceae bacterium]
MTPQFVGHGTPTTKRWQVPVNGIGASENDEMFLRPVLWQNDVARKCGTSHTEFVAAPSLLSDQDTRVTESFQPRRNHMAVRSSQAEWQGNLRAGNGTMKLGSGMFEGPFTFASRFESGKGTNPEELIGAAHAGCFSMFLAALLSGDGYVPNSVKTTATVHLGDGLTIKLKSNWTGGGRRSISTPRPSPTTPCGPRKAARSPRRWLPCRKSSWTPVWPRRSLARHLICFVIPAALPGLGQCGTRVAATTPAPSHPCQSRRPFRLKPRLDTIWTRKMSILPSCSLVQPRNDERQNNVIFVLHFTILTLPSRVIGWVRLTTPHSSNSVFLFNELQTKSQSV